MLRQNVAILLVVVAVFAASSVVSAASLVEWTFEASIPTTAGPHAAEVGSGSALGSHADVATIYSNPVGNGTTEAFSSDKWAAGDYYQFSTSTIGFSNIAISWDQIRSSSGPDKFDLAWSTDGTIFTTLVDDYAVVSSPSWSSLPANYRVESHFAPVSGPAALDNQAVVYFRMISQVTPTNTAGTCRIDNVVITPEPTTLALLAAAGAMFWRRRR